MSDNELQLTMSPTGFQAAWYASDLGRFRPCGGTYEVYPHESVPPLDPGRFTGSFDWLGGVGSPEPEQADRLGRLAESLSALGLTLPGDFVAFQTAANLHDRLDQVSVTACWSDISDPLPSPVEDGARLVRFLRDQQDCVFWYLYLRPSGETFVVFSGVDYEEYAARKADGEEKSGDEASRHREAHRRAIGWCAPTFEEFAYRFWVENRIWYTVQGADLSGLEPELRDYLSHYAPPEAASVEGGC
ncbi:hypothetical protein [Streptomyces sp. NPDC007264]|uniref:hypothetical protein n=1 Tax=Streptomyces sp. NPDC007264 TaxID=3364777 RepID=UPI0036D9E9DD